jgi:hypothetical protein
MTDLNGQIVEFHLSPNGRRALRGLIPAQGPYQAFVVATDDLGPLVHRPVAGSGGEAGADIPVMLLRWDYIATMTFALQIEEGLMRTPIGFRGK